MNFTPNYTYETVSEKPKKFSYQIEDNESIPKFYMEALIKNKLYTSKTINDYTIDYSSYYDWLMQEENVLAKCRLNSENGIVLTTKNVIIQKGRQKRYFPLRQIEHIDLTFKRLMLPLITGGITAPLSALATTNRYIEMLSGLLIMVVSLMLFYYGWLGTYQVSLDFKTYKINHFSDGGDDKLKDLIHKGNHLLRSRYQT